MNFLRKRTHYATCKLVEAILISLIRSIPRPSGGVFVFVFDPKTARGPLWTGPSAPKVLYLDLKLYILLLILANINGCFKGRYSCIPWLSYHISCNGFWQILFSNACTASFPQSSRWRYLSSQMMCAKSLFLCRSPFERNSNDLSVTLRIHLSSPIRHNQFCHQILSFDRH